MIERLRSAVSSSAANRIRKLWGWVGGLPRAHNPILGACQEICRHTHRLPLRRGVAVRPCARRTRRPCGYETDYLR